MVATEIKERTITSTSELAVYRRSDGKTQDAEYTGSFGGLGLMGLGVGGGGGAIGATAALVIGGVAVALILAMAGWALFEWWKIVQEFHNDDTNNWPIYNMGTTENNKQSATGSWSVRTFSDDGCGNPGLDEHGSKPYSQNHDYVPVMMTEYISSDLN